MHTASCGDEEEGLVAMETSFPHSAATVQVALGAEGQSGSGWVKAPSLAAAAIEKSYYGLVMEKKFFLLRRQSEIFDDFQQRYVQHHLPPP